MSRLWKGSRFNKIVEEQTKQKRRGRRKNCCTVRDSKHLHSIKIVNSAANIQLFPEREVNSDGYIYPPLFTDPEGDSCFSIYQIR